MIDKFYCKDDIKLFIEKIISSNKAGRTIIINGPEGCGKFTLANIIAQRMLGENPSLSSNALIYRNDNYELKTKFYLNKIENPLYKEMICKYILLLINRVFVSLSLNVKEKDLNIPKNDGMETLLLLQSKALDKTLPDYLKNNSKMLKFINDISAQLTKKRNIPIDFIRKLIDFFSTKSQNEKKICIIGNFEDADPITQNASLKIFEELPLNNYIILTTSNKKKLLPTVLSRSIIINLNYLNNNILKSIFPDAIINSEMKSTIEYFLEDLYHYKYLSISLVKKYFNNVVSTILTNNSLNNFLEEVEKDDNILRDFLVELIEFYRLSILLRFTNVRESKLINKEYLSILENYLSNIVLEDVETNIKSTLELLNLMNNTNCNKTILLMDYLINIARWWKKVIKK